MMMGILLPDEGSVTLLGGASDGPMRQQVGYLPEERGVYKKMKVIEQLESGREDIEAFFNLV